MTERPESKQLRIVLGIAAVACAVGALGCVLINAPSEAIALSIGGIGAFILSQDGQGVD